MKKNFTLSCVALLILLSFFLFTANNSHSDIEFPGTVLKVDNSEILHSGVGTLGIQTLSAIITAGQHKGKICTAYNHLNGQLALDELYRPGDKILLAIQSEDGVIVDAKSINLYRQNWEFALFALFSLALIFYAGVIGLKALLSFLLSLIIIWYFYIPSLLSGTAALPLSLGVLFLLSLVIILAVAGGKRYAIAAFLGTTSGLGFAFILTLFFGEKLQLFGLTAPFAPTLLMQGGYHLNLQHIFYSAVLLGASGAAMDIAVDISVSMNEIKEKRPDIPFKELLGSGLTVGRTVLGTMATTLLLAYSGGSLTMLMLFVAQDTSLARMLNMKVVAAEIFRILIGSMALLAVAPITALIAGILLHKQPHRQK